MKIDNLFVKDIDAITPDTVLSGTASKTKTINSLILSHQNTPLRNTVAKDVTTPKVMQFGSGMTDGTNARFGGATISIDATRTLVQTEAADYSQFPSWQIVELDASGTFTRSGPSAIGRYMSNSLATWSYCDMCMLDADHVLTAQQSGRYDVWYINDLELEHKLHFDDNDLPAAGISSPVSCVYLDDGRAVLGYYSGSLWRAVIVTYDPVLNTISAGVEYVTTRNNSYYGDQTTAIVRIFNGATPCFAFVSNYATQTRGECFQESGTPGTLTGTTPFDDFNYGNNQNANSSYCGRPRGFPDTNGTDAGFIMPTNFGSSYAVVAYHKCPVSTGTWAVGNVSAVYSSSMSYQTIHMAGDDTFFWSSSFYWSTTGYNKVQRFTRSAGAITIDTSAELPNSNTDATIASNYPADIVAFPSGEMFGYDFYRGKSFAVDGTGAALYVTGTTLTPQLSTRPTFGKMAAWSSMWNCFVSSGGMYLRYYSADGTPIGFEREKNNYCLIGVGAAIDGSVGYMATAAQAYGNLLASTLVAHIMVSYDPVITATGENCANTVSRATGSLAATIYPTGDFNLGDTNDEFFCIFAVNTSNVGVRYWSSIDNDTSDGINIGASSPQSCFYSTWFITSLRDGDDVWGFVCAPNNAGGTNYNGFRSVKVTNKTALSLATYEGFADNDLTELSSIVNYNTLGSRLTTTNLATMTVDNCGTLTIDRNAGILHFGGIGQDEKVRGGLSIADVAGTTGISYGYADHTANEYVSKLVVNGVEEFSDTLAFADADEAWSFHLSGFTNPTPVLGVYSSSNKAANYDVVAPGSVATNVTLTFSDGTNATSYPPIAMGVGKLYELTNPIVITENDSLTVVADNVWQVDLTGMYMERDV